MDTEKLITDTCENLLLDIAVQEKIDPRNLGIRIDLENESAKPILSVFNKSKFLKRIKIKELAKASGAGAMSGLVSMSIRKILQSIFKYGKEQYETSSTKELFLLIHLRMLADNLSRKPAIALYKQGVIKETKLLSDIISQAATS